MYRPSELSRFLQDLGIHAKKGLSQNFLIDGNVVRKIVATAKVAPGDVVLEIGPGPGALTEALLEAGAHVIAVEMDTVLAKALERFRTRDRQLDIVTADILEVSVEELLKPHLADGRRAKVIANLPYHVTTPILTRLAPLDDLLQSVTVMVQKEVAERMTSPAGSKVYGSLSVFLCFYATPHYAFTVSRKCFSPTPKVDSAVVHLDITGPRKVSNKDRFFQMTRTAFEHRRKMLRASLKELYSADIVTKALEALKMNVLARPEDLSIEELIDLFEYLQS
ncbi:MAG: 16S rRNA (adenine(1518)-N(6)/adenine(1519)-N(6))-dimethyltransferase RsmA [Nitrosomonas sp.]|nr:MAG: 16S rRNA (adenine(1518)-N(6)/adenine(1519)-N(6))-dimethyltransferase RsmA [Nitrosomonas sp.]